MFDQIRTFADGFGIPEQTLLIAGIGAGLLLITIGIGAILGERNPAADRIAALHNERFTARSSSGLLREHAKDPTGVWKAMIPTNLAQRADLTRKLARAGMTGPNALRNFIVARIVLGVLIPVLLIGLVMLARSPSILMPIPAIERLAEYSNQTLARLIVVLVAVGYFGPAKWLDDRAGKRQRAVEAAFPNALDLMQISVTAGLGFDSAMTRVGNELAKVSPEIAFELLTVQRQIQAGRPRDEALRDMALRTGVDTVLSFANVVTQSMQLGTSMADALTSYANEMRENREIRAQEAANKLPVKFSGVLASLMLPALILLTVGPVVIRYVRFFGE